MWIIGYTGTAKTKDGDDYIVVLRERAAEGRPTGWRILVNESRSRFPKVYKTRDEAMRQAETWIQLRNMEK